LLISALFIGSVMNVGTPHSHPTTELLQFRYNARREMLFFATILANLQRFS
jgi:hypothetical protein